MTTIAHSLDRATSATTGLVASTLTITPPSARFATSARRS